MPKNIIKLLLVIILIGIGVLGILNRDTIATTFGPLFIFNKFTATAASNGTYQDVQGDVKISGNTDITGNLIASGRITGVPIVGRWYASNNSDGEGYYKWGTEIFNTNPSYLSRSADQKAITVGVAGYYLISVNVLQKGLAAGTRGDVYLRRIVSGSPQNIGFSLGSGSTGSEYYKHHLSVIEYFSANEQIAVLNVAPGLIYGTNDPWSSLEIYRLN